MKKLLKAIPFFLMLLTLSLGVEASPQVKEEPVTLNVAGMGEVYGTLMIPDLPAKMPVVLIIAGSGPTDRDGNNPQMKNNSLKMLAEALADRGIASLRFDKRGIAASSGIQQKEIDLRFDDYVDDAKSLVALLKSDDRFSEVIIAGHSEGSLIGMLALDGVDRYISLAGAGESIDVTLRRQLSAQPAQIQEMTTPIIDSLKKGVLVPNVSPFLASLFRESVQPYMISWMKYDPPKILSGVKIPILILQGDKDIQIGVKDAENLAIANKDAKMVIIKNMNHIFKIIEGDQTENIASYTNPTLPISEVMVEEMVSFIKGK